MAILDNIKKFANDVVSAPANLAKKIPSSVKVALLVGGALTVLVAAVSAGAIFLPGLLAAASATQVFGFSFGFLASVSSFIANTAVAGFLANASMTLLAGIGAAAFAVPVVATGLFAAAQAGVSKLKGRKTVVVADNTNGNASGADVANNTNGNGTAPFMVSVAGRTSRGTPTNTEVQNADTQPTATAGNSLSA